MDASAPPDGVTSLQGALNPFWIWMQIAIIVLVIISAVIAIVKLY